MIHLLERRTRHSVLLGALLTVGLALLAGVLSVSAFHVPAIPSDNLIVNPWFRAANDNTVSALDSWTDANGLNRYWSSSQKESNPSPDVFPSAVCGSQPTYCGTAARLSETPGESGGVGLPGVTARLYQVVSADPSHNQLTFFAHWVSHVIDHAEVNIYGSTGPGGPWTFLWQPFYHEQDSVVQPPPGGDVEDLWEMTGFLSVSIAQGYPYYKVEVEALLPQSDKQTGFKITGVYFRTQLDGGPGPTSSPPPASSRTPPPGPTNTPLPGPTVTPPPDATRTPQPDPTLTPTPTPTTRPPIPRDIDTLIFVPAIRR